MRFDKKAIVILGMVIVIIGLWFANTFILDKYGYLDFVQKTVVLIREIVVVFVTVVGLLRVSSWKDEFLGKDKYAVIKKIYRLVYKIEKALADSRSMVIYPRGVREKTDRLVGIYLGASEEYEGFESDVAMRALYHAKIELVSDLVAELEYDLLLEATWFDVNLELYVDKFKVHVTKLYIAALFYYSNERGNLEPDKVLEYEKLLGLNLDFGSGEFVGGDEIGEEIVEIRDEIGEEIVAIRDDIAAILKEAMS